MRDSDLDEEFDAMERQISSAHGKASAARRAQVAAEKERDDLRAELAALRAVRDAAQSVIDRREGHQWRDALDSLQRALEATPNG